MLCDFGSQFYLRLQTRLMNVANWNLKVYPRFRGYSEWECAEGCEDVSDDACLPGARSAASNFEMISLWPRQNLDSRPSVSM